MPLLIDGIPGTRVARGRVAGVEAHVGTSMSVSPVVGGRRASFAQATSVSPVVGRRRGIPIVSVPDDDRLSRVGGRHWPGLRGDLVSDRLSPCG